MRTIKLLVFFFISIAKFNLLAIYFEISFCGEQLKGDNSHALRNPFTNKRVIIINCTHSKEFTMNI
jgi:hypothetical protein